MKSTKTHHTPKIILVCVLFLLTFNCLLIYVITQQSLRLSANHRPIEIANDLAIKLEAGNKIEVLVASDKTDISKSLSPFVMIYDPNKTLMMTSGLMGNTNPVYPSGVFAYVDQHKTDQVTWQTSNGLRYASVVIKTSNGYIVVAQSLKQTENLIGLIGELDLIAWILGVIFSFGIFGISQFMSKPRV